MFARQAFRVAQPLTKQPRRYASAATAAKSSTTLYVGLAAATGLGGYYYVWKTNRYPKIQAHIKERASEAAGKAHDVSAKAKDAASSATGGAKDKVAEQSSVAFTGGDQGFISLKLESVENINHNTKRFRFSLPEKDQVSGLQIASAILTKFKGSEDQKPTIRPYTPVSDEEDKGYLDLLVKKYPNGPMSTHLHDMTPGQLLEFKGPIPKYPWTANKHDHIALIAGGTGITPMYQLARAIFNNSEADKTKVTLVFGNISEEDILLKKEFEDLENTYPQRFRAFYVLDNPPEGWTGGAGGHINQDMLKQVLPEPKSENIKLFVCGPPGLYKAISGTKKSPTDQGELAGYLKELGYSPEQVYKF